MVATSQILPLPLLAPFVSCYLLHEFDTAGLDLLRPWFAVHKVYLSFFLKNKPLHLFNENTGYLVKGSEMAFQGLSTRFNGIILLNGRYSIFNICFKPNGFHKLFRFPLNEANNKIFNLEDIFSIPARALYEQLQNSKDVRQMAAFADKFLFHFFTKQKPVELYDNITIISNSMTQNAGVVNIGKFAYEANMSLRNFERKFGENIGISPKLFCRIIRFNHALKLKIKNIAKDWSSIAQESGYYDQMHLIKDFKEFAGNSPNHFLNLLPPPAENIQRIIR